MVAIKPINKRILVTSALPYVNNVPHLGNLIGCVLSADVFARFQRSLGRNVLYVCGTDEHGTTTEAKAKEEGLTPKEVCDKYFEIHKHVYNWFNCSFDCLGRTSSEENKEITLDIFKKLDENGYIIEKEVEQAYCAKCEKFLADRYVEGTCPECGYTEARGDQCEKCGSLLNAHELKDSKCKICGSKPEIRKTNHLFLDLPKIEPELREWIDTVKEGWSANAVSQTRAWLDNGLRERAITRDLKWGIPVPKEGYENKVIYCWFDAPIGYIGITKECLPNEWENWWKNDTTRLIQFMGKDNIPFHTILFPSFLIGAKDDYILLSDLSVNEYLNFEGGMFSKSRGVGVFGDDAEKSGIKADIWRYYLMVNRPEKTDTEFSWKDLQSKINNELVATLGNLVNRTTVFLKKYFDSKIPKPDHRKTDDMFKELLKEHYVKIGAHFETIKLKDALKEIMQVAKIGNQYFQENEPWKTVNEDKSKAGTALNVLANLAKDLAILIEPFMPDSAESIKKQLNISDLQWDNLGEDILKDGHQINEPEILFEKVDDKMISELTEKHSGKKRFALDLRVAEIKNVKPHPDADKLLIIDIDIGEKRTIVAGLAKFYKPEELVGKKIVVVSNLEPAMLRGIKSNGMLLAADSAGDVVLVDSGSAKPGSKVYVKVMDNNPKKIKYDDFAKIKLKVKDKKVFADGKELIVDGSKIRVNAKDGSKVR